MTNNEILNVLENVVNGRYYHITKTKPLGNGVEKQSEMCIRLGVSYSNMAINENRIPEPLKWGHWVEGLENLVIEHNGNYYLRITSQMVDGKSDTTETRYYVNGVETDKESALALADSKLTKPSKPSPVYNIKFENILAIG